MLDGVKSQIVKSIDEKVPWKKDLDVLKSVVDKQRHAIQEQQRFLTALATKENGDNPIVLAVAEHDSFLDKAGDIAKMAEFGIPPQLWCP